MPGGETETLLCTYIESCFTLLIILHNNSLNSKPLLKEAQVKTNISQLVLFSSPLPPLDSIQLALSISRCSLDTECMNKGVTESVHQGAARRGPEQERGGSILHRGVERTGHGEGWRWRDWQQIQRLGDYCD